MPFFRFIIVLLSKSHLLFGSGLAVSTKPALNLVPGTLRRASVYDEVKIQLSNVSFEYANALNLQSNRYDTVGIERAADVNVVT